ncbi:hypothetical protein WIS52_16280 [Pseudonocardia nematodicida]|uniref:Uncharacterized protein n=1 Tax=Pseudonocardia nematodicida TaxID=1206997 RepID=A0ABV1KC29_9PSEU
MEPRPQHDLEHDRLDDHEPEQHTPGPSRPATRRVVALVLIVALVGAFPLSFLVGAVGTEVVAALLVAAGLIGGLIWWLHRRTM